MFQRDIENWYKFDFVGVGEYGVPVLDPEIIQTKQFIPFNYVKGCKCPEEKGVHFYLHDYQFRRIWDMPERYMLMLQKFDCVLTPDYSIYTDMPKAMQIYHHYKKQWMGAYWQANGITVVPTVSWSDDKSYSWCFDGIPKESAISVSSVGCMKNQRNIELFLNGYQEMVRRLNPKQILFYGTVPEQIDTTSVIQIRSFQEKFKGKR